jgi:glycosyltransferase involved in cell wall biosynthesis
MGQKMNENLPKVSIVLPTYNGAKYIRQSIDSCLNQIYRNIELIIVDDCSTDGIPEIIKSYKDKRIKYIRHEKNKGLPSALNTGFALATGEYLTWTSDDNYYVEEAVEKMLSFMKWKKSSFIYCDYHTFKNDNSSDKKIVRLPDTKVIENDNDVGPCFLYSREVMSIVGDYDPVTVLAEDYDYWIRISKYFHMNHLNEPLYFFRSHEGSLTSRYVRQYDVQIASLLVRVKNDIIDAEQATTLFINLIAKKNVTLMPKSLSIIFLSIKYVTLNNINSYDVLCLFAAKFTKEVNMIYKNFKMGNISFVNARSSLKEIINRRLI